MTEKKKPGTKDCPRCERQHGARKVLCECGFKFTIMVGATKRAKKRRGEPVDWKTLEPNDYIRAGKGPYYLSDMEEEPISMSSSGLFRVKEIKQEGILCYPLGCKGIEYLYMGKFHKSKKTGTMMRPHKVTKVEPRYAMREPV